MVGSISTFLTKKRCCFIVILIGFFVVIITMGSILGPLLTGIVLAYVMQDISKNLVRMQIPGWLALTITYFLFLGGFIGFLFFIIPHVWRQMQNLFNELPNMVDRAQEMLAGLPQNYPNLISDQQIQLWVDTLNSNTSSITQWIVSYSISQLPVLVSLVIYILLVPILVLFLLKDKDRILAWCLSFLPRNRPLMNQVGVEMNMQMANYIRGKFYEFLIVGVTSYILFAMFGLNYALLLAFLVGLSVIVPYLGFIVVTIPVLIIAWAAVRLVRYPFIYRIWHTSFCRGSMAWFSCLCCFSEAVNLHPIAIIIAVLVFGSWWGLWGVFFAIPLATLVKAIITGLAFEGRGSDMTFVIVKEGFSR